ncbi:hypothetical protein OC834_003056 [Tilletia horrida]|nr:hypothetical protein OC834_003056 [Tilletia horrida]
MKDTFQHVPPGFVAVPCGILDVAGNEKAVVVTKMCLFDRRFDGPHMQDTFYNFLRAWPLLAGRLRKGSGRLGELWSTLVPTRDKLEELIQADRRGHFVFKSAVPMFSYAERQHESLFDVVPLASLAQNPERLSQESPTIATVDRESMLRELTSPHGVKRMGEYFTRDASIFTAHVSNFADGAAFTFTAPHACFDGAGAKAALDAYLHMLKGEPIGPIVQAGYDPFLPFVPSAMPPSSPSSSSSSSAISEKPSAVSSEPEPSPSSCLPLYRPASSSARYPPPPPQPKHWRIFSLMHLLVLCFYIARDYLFDRPESKMSRVLIYVPPKFAAGLKEQVVSQIKADHGAEKLQELRVSRGNALHAWVLQNELARRVEVRPNRLTTHLTVSNMRYRLPAGLSSIDPTFTGNCIVPIVAPVTTTKELAAKSLGAVAYDVRTALLQQCTPTEMERYVRWQAWRGTPRAQGGGLEQTGMAALFPCRARITLVTDWSKFGLWDLDWSGAVAGGSGAAAAARHRQKGRKVGSTSSVSVAVSAGGKDIEEEHEHEHEQDDHERDLDHSAPKEGADSSSTITAAAPSPAEKCGMLMIVADAHVPLHQRNGWVMIGGRDGACWILGGMSDEERRHPRGWGRYADAVLAAEA